MSELQSISCLARASGLGSEYPEGLFQLYKFCSGWDILFQKENKGNSDMHSSNDYLVSTAWVPTNTAPSTRKYKGWKGEWKRPRLSLHKVIIQQLDRISPHISGRTRSTSYVEHCFSTSVSTVNCYSEYRRLLNVNAWKILHCPPTPKPKP